MESKRLDYFGFSTFRSGSSIAAATAAGLFPTGSSGEKLRRIWHCLAKTGNGSFGEAGSCSLEGAAEGLVIGFGLAE